MRYTGGLLGGSWAASLMADLGNGRFDGAHLVSNFENLDPANTYWKKLYGLYSKVDTEPPRLPRVRTLVGAVTSCSTRTRSKAIVQHLFVGNKLTSGELQVEGYGTIDMRNIRSPIVSSRPSATTSRRRSRP
jgi:poly(3-hydroxyalkanoate) synthetase